LVLFFTFKSQCTYLLKNKIEVYSFDAWLLEPARGSVVRAFASFDYDSILRPILNRFQAMRNKLYRIMTFS